MTQSIVSNVLGFQVDPITEAVNGIVLPSGAVTPLGSNTPSGTSVFAQVNSVTGRISLSAGGNASLSMA